MECEYCGKEFKPIKKNGKYCKKKCKEKARYLRRRDKVLKYKKRWEKENPILYKERYAKKNAKFRKLKETWSKKKLEEFLEKSRKANAKWRNNNREKYRASLRKYYYVHKIGKKDKWNCVSITWQISIKDNWERFCKLCNFKENLEIHHEIYPKGSEGIRKAHKEGKIYFVCYDCHRTIHMKK